MAKGLEWSKCPLSGNWLNELYYSPTKNTLQWKKEQSHSLCSGMKWSPRVLSGDKKQGVNQICRPSLSLDLNEQRERETIRETWILIDSLYFFTWDRYYILSHFPLVIYAEVFTGEIIWCQRFALK